MIVISMWGVFTRKKKYAATIDEGTRLARVLSTLDLTALGIGSTLGVGVYIIAGQVARQIAGPAVIVSFLIAALASILSGLCYAEFGARIPRAGSAYVYTYVTVGELVAFIIGWNLILEYVIGAASVAKGISLYIDSLASDVLKDAFKEIAPINVSIMAEYFDFFAFGLAILLSVALAVGLKESTKLNNFATVVNVCVVLFIIIAGAIKSDISNWRVPANETVPEIGKGGFLPFGVGGMLKGAATCFYAFVGFDCIATTGEEVKNPKRAIPFAIIGSQITIFIGYFCTSTVLTLMVPYYEQDVNAPFPYAFLRVGWDNVKWVVAIGGICGLFTSLFGSMFPLPRILYALASDGLIFKFLGKVNATFSTPMVGTLLAGFITGLMAALFDLAQLVNMMSIGTLLAYTLVSTCVLILRYRDVYMYEDDTSKKPPITNKSNGKISTGFAHIFNTRGHKDPTRQSHKISLAYILIYCALAFVMALLLFLLYSHLAEGRLYMIILISVIGGFMILSLILLAFQPTSREALSFKVPFVPIIPAFSILINIYLMLMLDSQTWIRFGIWMFIGIPIYLFCVRKACGSPQSTSPPQTPLQSHKLANNHTNSAFVIDENSSCPSEEKPPSEDSGIARSMENIQASGLEDDEKVLEKEEGDGDKRGKEEEVMAKSRNSITSIEIALATLDNAISGEDDNNNNFDDFDEETRKNSIGNVSNVSSLELIKEDVVALVHREDVRSIPTTPIAEVPSAPPLSDESDISDAESVERIIFSTQVSQNQEQSPRPSIILSDDIGAETDTDMMETETFSIPPAPPLDGFENYKPMIPRVSLSKNEISKPSSEDEFKEVNNIPPPPSMEGFEMFKPPIIPKVKTPTSPVLNKDYSKEPSVSNKVSLEDPESEPSEDNMKFGDKLHLLFKDKLNKLLMNNVVTQAPPQPKLTKPPTYPVEDTPEESTTLKPVMSQIISEINRNSIVRDTENETPQTPDDFRNRLDALLKSTRVNPMNPSPNKPRKTLNLDRNVDLETTNSGKDMESHKMNMRGTLNSIKLRNIEKNT